MLAEKQGIISMLYYYINKHIMSLAASVTANKGECFVLWMNALTLKRMSNTLFGKHVRCSTHGHSFVRLWCIRVAFSRYVH